MLNSRTRPATESLRQASVTASDSGSNTFFQSPECVASRTVDLTKEIQGRYSSRCKPASFNIPWRIKQKHAYPLRNIAIPVARPCSIANASSFLFHSSASSVCYPSVSQGTCYQSTCTIGDLVLSSLFSTYHMTYLFNVGNPCVWATQHQPANHRQTVDGNIFFCILDEVSRVMCWIIPFPMYSNTFSSDRPCAGKFLMIQWSKPTNPLWSLQTQVALSWS